MWALLITFLILVGDFSNAQLSQVCVPIQASTNGCTTLHGSDINACSGNMCINIPAKITCSVSSSDAKDSGKKFLIASPCVQLAIHGSKLVLQNTHPPVPQMYSPGMIGGNSGANSGTVTVNIPEADVDTLTVTFNSGKGAVGADIYNEYLTGFESIFSNNFNGFTFPGTLANDFLKSLGVTNGGVLRKIPDDGRRPN